MKNQQLLVVLTLINLGLLSFQVARSWRAEAKEPLPVLRGSGLQIVDDQGRIRASISVLPESKNYKKANGKLYPETVLLRLIDPNGRPTVKLGASVDGSALAMGGDTDKTYIQLISDGPESYVRLTAPNKPEKILKP